jgi:hypothetical protein
MGFNSAFKGLTLFSVPATDLRVQNQKPTYVSLSSVGAQDNNLEYVFKEIFFPFSIGFYCQQFFMVINLTSHECSCMQYKLSSRFDSLEIQF